jgi:hypothetical protein
MTEEGQSLSGLAIQILGALQIRYKAEAGEYMDAESSHL